MVLWRNLRLLLPHHLREMPVDLAVIVLLVGLTNAVVFLPVGNGSSLRFGLGLVFLLFVPGYAFVAAVFPESGGEGRRGTTDDADAVVNRRIDGVERLALSIVLSLALVPIAGLAVNFSPWGVRLGSIMVSITVLTLVCLIIATVRRRSIPESEQFQVPYRGLLATSRRELLEPDSRTDAVLNVLVVVSVLVASASVGYAVLVPKSDEQFTELYLLTESEEGDLVASDYPTNFTAGDRRPVVVGVDNNEQRVINYTLVVAEQRVRIQNNDTRALETAELSRTRFQLADNETWRRTIDIEPSMTGENVRVVFLLYAGPPDDTLSTETAYRSTHLWINVSRPA